MNQKQLENHLLTTIERLEAFEDRMNVSLEKLTIRINDVEEGYFTIFGELHPKDGEATLEEGIKLMCIVYNNEGGIIAKEDYIFEPEEFFGFEVFDFNLYENVTAHEVGSIRIYPTKY